jgi:TPR repeat protein
MLALGILYQGPVRGRKRDLAKALQWYCQSYKNGLPEALDDVARCVEVCLEEEAVDDALIQWLEEEAKGGVPAPQAVIARAIIWQSENNPRGQNYAEALKWYRKAAKLDEAEGKFLTARFLVLKNLTKEECERVSNWFLPSEEGLVEWSRNTGNQEKVAAEKSEALKLLEAAGNDGYCRAIRFLSCMYTRGIGVSQAAKEKGMSLLTKSAELDDARAQALLGAALVEGIGCQADAQTGFYWLEKAASAEDSFAQWNLALCLLEGRGTRVDLAQANSLLAKAAQAHFTQDKEWSEDGFASRFARLLAGFNELAKQGNADAQFWLGVCLEDGVGVERNREESAENYLLASEQGHEQAKLAFDRTPQNIQALVKKRITSHLLKPRL